MRKSLLPLLIGIFLLFLLSACASENSNQSNSEDKTNNDSKDTESSSDVIELKLGTKMPSETSEGIAFDKFAELVEEKTNGEVVVQVYPAEQLGKGTTQIDNMIMGTQDMYAEGSTYFSDFDKRLEVASVPYLFEDFEHFQKFNTGKVGKYIQKNLIDQGIRFLNTERNFVRGPYRVLLSSTPVQTLDDLEGLRMRSFESSIYPEVWSALGVNPIVVAWTETYLAIKQGTVDAVTSPISLVRGMNFAEVAPYMTVIDEYPQDIVIAVSEESFRRLNKEQQQAMIEAANEAGEIGTQLAKDSIEEDIAFMKEENGLEVIEIDKEKWVNAAQPVHEQLEKDGFIPEGMVEAVNSAK